MRETLSYATDKACCASSISREILRAFTMRDKLNGYQKISDVVWNLWKHTYYVYKQYFQIKVKNIYFEYYVKNNYYIFF